MTERIPVARQSDLVIQEIGDEILVYDLADNRALSLNITSSFVWKYADGTRTMAEIANSLTAIIGDRVDEDLVRLAIEQLAFNNLILNDYTARRNGTSRREMIRKVGAATLVAFPNIVALVAPSAVHAQSASCSTIPFSLNCACTSNANCVSGCCGVSAVGESCVAVDATPVGQPCRGNCECAGTSTCPSCIGLPRVCRIGGCPP